MEGNLKGGNLSEWLCNQGQTSPINLALVVSILELLLIADY